MPTRPETFPYEVPHKLNDDEKNALNDEAMGDELRAKEIDARIKSSTADLKLQAKQLRADASRKREAAFKREELRTVMCREEVRGFQVFIVRCDTGETVHQAALSAQDAEQLELRAKDGDDELPLPADYTPGKNSPKGSREKPARKAKKKR